VSDKPTDRRGNRGDEEQRLLARLRRRDEAAFVQLVDLNRARMTGAAMRILRNQEDARDAVQTAFAAAFAAINGFDGRSTVGTWLHRIVVNAALIMLRTRRRRREDSVSPTSESDGFRRLACVHSTAAADSPEAVAMRNEDAARLRTAIRGLAPDQRRLIVLRDLRELSTLEAARRLALTPSATKVRLHRARRALRTLYRDLPRGQPGA